MVCYYAKWIGSAVYQRSGIEFRWGKIKSFRAKILTEKLLVWMFIWDCWQQQSGIYLFEYIDLTLFYKPTIDLTLVYNLTIDLKSIMAYKLTIDLSLVYKLTVDLTVVYKPTIDLTVVYKVTIDLTLV